METDAAMQPCARERCGALFAPRNGKRYCSDRCGRRAKKARDRQRDPDRYRAKERARKQRRPLKKGPRERLVFGDTGAVVARWCCTCRAILSAEKFAPMTNGLGGLAGSCRTCIADKRAAKEGRPARAVVWRKREEARKRLVERIAAKRAEERHRYVRTKSGTLVAKRCRTCCTMRPLSEFYRTTVRRSAGGVIQTCKYCETQTHRRRRFRRLPAWQVRAVTRLLGGACLACGATDKIQLDHVVPLARGGGA